MKLPWVSRDRLEQACAAAKVGTEYYGHRIEALEREIEYWRDKYEKEQARADRAVDSLVVASGHQPISEESRTEVSKISDASIEMSKQITEIFGDVENSVVEDPSTQADEVAAKPPTKEEIETDRNTRLAVIKARIDARNAEKEIATSATVTTGA